MRLDGQVRPIDPGWGRRVTDVEEHGKHVLLRDRPWASREAGVCFRRYLDRVLFALVCALFGVRPPRTGTVDERRRGRSRNRRVLRCFSYRRRDQLCGRREPDVHPSRAGDERRDDVSAPNDASLSAGAPPRDLPVGALAACRTPDADVAEHHCRGRPTRPTGTRRSLFPRRGQARSCTSPPKRSALRACSASRRATRSSSVASGDGGSHGCDEPTRAHPGDQRHAVTPVSRARRPARARAWARGRHRAAPC